MGTPPGTFITDRRLAVAERLLAEPWLPIWKITQLLGYSSIQVFSRAFFRRKGIRPKDFRQRATGEGSALPATPAVSDQSHLPALALAGRLDDQEAADLIHRLLEIYPPGRRRSQN